MPRFYFEYEFNGEIIVDEDGRQLPDLTAAMLMARQDARELAGDFLRGGAMVLPVFITVLDENRRKLSSVDLKQTIFDAIDSAFRRGSE